MDPSLPSCHPFALFPISFPASSPPSPCSSSVLSSSARARPTLAPFLPGSQISSPHALPQPGSPRHSRFRVPSPSLTPSPHTPSPQLSHRGPASPGPPLPSPGAPCPVSPHPAPLPQARPRRGGAARFAPPPPVVTTNHSARLFRRGRREPIAKRVRGAGGGASVSRPQDA